MECDVCGHEMQRQPIPPSRWAAEVWSCAWCYASTCLGGKDFEVLRVPYAEIDDRWDQAYSYELFDKISHACVGPHQTLCGITHPDIAASPWPWHHLSGNPCPDCFAVARVVDERWPVEKRDHSDRHSVRTERELAFVSQEFATDWSKSADDQLGRPDLVLNCDPADRYVQPPTTAVSGPTPFPASWYGTSLGVYRPWTWTSPDPYPMSHLPQLDPQAFTGDFSWMGGIGDPISLRVTQVEKINAELKDVGLALPSDFEALATGTNPHTALDRSGSFMTLRGPLINPAEPGARMIHFLYEQARRWYLYLRPTGESFIVHSREFFEESDADNQVRRREDDSPENSIFWCAPSAEVFAYRFRTETIIARAVNERRRARDLTPGIRAYLAAALHCRVT